MIKDERNFHLRLQEFCDCFMETDYKKELEAASKGSSGDPSGDPDELALKFLGLTLLYGANEEARKISLQRSKEGKVSFAVEARGDYQLPPPSAKVADRVISIARSITHIDKDKGKSPLSLGLRSDRMEIKLEFDRKGGGESLSLVFPKS
ncbi:MAG TPA: hypothetical protein VEH09_13965 [Thermodesulfobacteriota bacterium]|nr:hypothetical protein [Thermodesulfobacteriota bacterium]